MPILLSLAIVCLVNRHDARSRRETAKLYQTWATSTSDKVLKEAYKLAAQVALVNVSRAKALVVRAKKVNVKEQNIKMAILDMEDQEDRVQPMLGRPSNCPNGQVGRNL